MSHCICPHGDANEPYHDRSCPARPVFDRFKAQQFVHMGNCINDIQSVEHRMILNGLVYQLHAAIQLIGSIPLDALTKATMPIAGAFIPWPDDKPTRYNACTDPCDMWTGPCACGAFHKDGQ